VPITEIPLRSVPRADRTLVQQLMTAHGSVVRDADGLAAAARRLENAVLRRLPRSGGGFGGSAVRDDPADATSTPDCAAAQRITAFEDASLTLAARVLLLAAAARTESRGCHTRSDHPQPTERQRHSVAFRLGSEGQPVPAPDGFAVADLWSLDPLPTAS
jgi:L-aspartate oxidase